ncbi:hypothetical protein IPL85_02500 [Candidatus Saccharibacteria bacterium]|nr:MAG: hypothetical protein IPL85_02500 [Candidatus Saccharibacteria bacterium]
MSENNTPLAVKGIAAAASLGIFLSGCTEGSSVSSDVATSRPSDGHVLYVGEGSASPTDTLANQLAQTQAMRAKTMEKGADLAALEANTGTLAVGAAALKKTIQFKMAEKTLPFPDQSRYDKTMIDNIQFQKASNQITDPDIRKSYQEIFKSGIVTKVLNGVRFDDIEQDEARASLDSVEPKLSEKYSKTLDDLDVSGAVIRKYYDPAAILEDITDVRSLALKEKATKYANTQTGSSASRKLYKELSTQGDEAIKVAEAASDSYFTKFEVERRYLAAGKLVDAAAREVIINHNAGIVAPQEVTFHPLDNPSKKIDLKQVKGPKKYYSTLDPSKPPLAQFAEVYVQNGNVAFRFEEGSNVTSEAAAQMQKIVGDVSPLLAHAFQAGDLVTVRFIIGNTYNPYFVLRAKEVHMVLSDVDPLSEEQLRQGLVHEVTHSMVDAAFGEEIISKHEASLVKNACRLLTNEAYSQYTQALKLSPEAVQRLIDKTSGDAQKFFLNLKERVDTGSLSEIAESSMAESVVTETDINWTDCNDHTFGDFAVALGYDAGLSNPRSVYKNIQEKYMPDALSGPTPTSGNATATPASTESNDPDFYAVVKGWDDAVSKYSLFRRLNEASFVRTDSWTKEYLGHSRDNAHELMATVFDVSLSNPAELKQLISGLNANERNAVYAAINATYTTITSRHPALATSLRAWQAQFII